MKAIVTAAMGLSFAAASLPPHATEATGRFASPALQIGSSPARPLNPGHLLYHEAQRRLLMLTAYPPPDVPELALLWAWEKTGWRLLPSTSGPTMRTLSGAVYDSRRKRIVLYGGLGNRGLADPRGDTWEWDGQSWVQMPVSGVGTRDHHSMAYDQARGRTVMYGGVSSIGSPPAATRVFPIDTWEWDGVTWTKIVASGPGPRGGAGMVYDLARKHVVLFGGIGLVPGAVARFADTWTWDGNRWRKVSDEGPVGRNGHAMAFDRRTGTVIMWGGTTGGAHLDDLWRWDGRRWTEIAVIGPRPGKRVGAGMVYDVAKRRIVLYGGRIRDDGKVRDSDEMWEWDGERWTQVQ